MSTKSFNSFIFLFLTFLIFVTEAFSDDSSKEIVDNKKYPVISFPEIFYDFGKVDQGVSLEHDFIVKNEGNQDLVIRDIHTSCGCTAAVLKEPIVKPGKESAIRVAFNTSGFSGPKSKTVRIYSNDPKNPSVVLKVSADITQEFYAEPSIINFLNVDRGYEEEKKILFKSVKGKSNPFRDAKSKSEFFTASSKKLDSGDVEITVKLSENIPGGAHHSRLVISTSDRKIPVVIVPVRIEVKSDFRITPKVVSFGYYQNDITEPITKEILIEKITDNPEVSIKKVSTSVKSVSAKLFPQPENKYKIVLSLLPGASGVIRGNVVIDIEHPDPKENKIEIPFNAIVDKDAK